MQPDIEVLVDLHKHARFLRTCSKNNPTKAVAAAKWEIFFEDKLKEARANEQRELELAAATDHKAA